MGFSFETVDARDYEELRPGYAPEAAGWVFERAGLEPGSLVVDLAAGTGQLSRRFLELGARVVEPAGNLRRVLSETLPSVRVVEGAAEAIPLPDGEAEVVVVGNAFHHFDPEPAFAEIHRVLRPAGVLALFWARSSDEGSILPRVHEIDEAVERSRQA